MTRNTLLELNTISGIIVDRAFAVHTILGPGLFESVYKNCLRIELQKKGLRVEVEKILPVTYDLDTFDSGFRLDLLVEGEVIVETKACSQLSSLHRAQLLSYLRMSHKQLGLLINFNVPHLKTGIVRLVNNLNEMPYKHRFSYTKG